MGWIGALRKVCYCGDLVKEKKFLLCSIDFEYNGIIRLVVGKELKMRTTN